MLNPSVQLICPCCGASVIKFLSELKRVDDDLYYYVFKHGDGDADIIVPVSVQELVYPIIT